MRLSPDRDPACEVQALADRFLGAPDLPRRRCASSLSIMDSMTRAARSRSSGDNCRSLASISSTQGSASGCDGRIPAARKTCSGGIFRASAIAFAVSFPTWRRPEMISLIADRLTCAARARSAWLHSLFLSSNNNHSLNDVYASMLQSLCPYACSNR